MNRENLLWVISTDGNIVTKTKTANLRQHIDILENFFEENNFEKPSNISINGYAECLTNKNIALIINIGNIDGKLACCVYLPEHLSKNQIDTFLNLKPTFEENFHHSSSFFGVSVYSTYQTSKINNNHFIDLDEESKKKGVMVNDGIELLYQWLQSQIENIPSKTR